MGERSAPGGIDREPDAFEDGRYLYCAVRPDGDRAFSHAGLDDREAYLVAAGEIGVVVQETESVFDADDPGIVTRWLLRHQAVVTAAADAFDTPVPFRFDTIVTGDDERVREWLDDTEASLGAALDSVAGRREYRIEVAWDEAAIAEDDERLRELRDDREAATDGRGFLVEKQIERRLNELKRRRREERATALIDRLDPHVDTIREVDRSVSILGDDDEGPSVTLAALADPNEEEAIGETLDDVAAADGVEVRFTGPWPPYSFVPEL